MAGRLTTIQQGIYLSCIANPSSTLYNLPYLGRFRDPVDPGKLRSALLAAAAAHPALNSVLREQPDGSVILEEDSVPFDVPVTEVTGAEFEKLRGELVRPFDLAGGKLARIELYVTEDDLYIFEDMHHVIFDGTSMNVLADDVRRVLDGKQPEPETLTVYAAADKEAEWLESQQAREAREYWTRLLEGYDPDCRPEQDVWDGSPCQKWLEEDLTLDEERFSALRHGTGFSTTAFFTAVFALTVSVFAGRDDVLFNTVTAGRDTGNERTVGMFVRTLPFRTDLGRFETVAELLKAAGEADAAGRVNSRYSYLKLSEEFGIKPELTFAYQRDFAVNRFVRGLDIETERIYDINHIEDTPILFEVYREAP